jgi:hypothetical protein
MPLRPSSLLRAAGPAAAVLMPSDARRRSRALVTGGTYAASAAIDPHGIQFVSVGMDGPRTPAWVARASTPVTGTVSWVAAQQLLVPAVRRLPVPGPVAAALYGVVLYVADERLAALGRRAAKGPEQAPATTD